MKITKSNKKERWIETAKKLKAWEIKLIELRNEGFDYNTIRDNLRKDFAKFKNSFKTNANIRALLYRGGRLYEAKMIYGELAAEESFEAGQQIIKNSHQRASMTMVSLLGASHQEHVRLNAAKDILDRNAGKATLPMEIKDNREIERLEEQVKNILQSNANTKRIAERFKHNIGRAAKSEKPS